MSLPPFVSVLSKRQIQVLALLARGYSNGQIAVELDIKPHTVEVHIGGIYNGLGIDGSHDRSAARVKAALRYWQEVDIEAANGRAAQEQSNDEQLAPIYWTPENIRCLRTCGLLYTQDQFAAVSGIASETLTDWETERRQPGLYNIARLDVIAHGTGWTPNRCRMLCRRRTAA